MNRHKEENLRNYYQKNMRLFKLFWIFIFIIGALTPLFYMNTAKITKQENRVLSDFPELKKCGKININYGKEFDAWLGDRFWGRDQLIRGYFRTISRINGWIENRRAFVGDNGWMFEKSKTVNRPSIEKQREKIERDAEILKAFADKLHKKNIPIYFILIPEREVLYQKYWEQYYVPKPYLDYGEEITRLLKDSFITVVNPKAEMLKAMTTENIYYQGSDHLSCASGFRIFLNKIHTVLKQKELPYLSQEPVPILKENQKFYVANIAAQLGFPSRVKQTGKSCGLAYINSRYQEKESKSYIEKQKTLWVPEQIIYRKGEVKDPLVDKTLVSIGPCYSEGVFDLFKSLYRYSIWIRINIDVYGRQAEEYNISKIKELFDLKPNSAIVILTQDNDFKLISEAIKE